MGAGSSSRLVGAIGAVAVIVVDSANGEGERRVGDTGEAFRIFVELCNFISLSARDPMALGGALREGFYELTFRAHTAWPSPFRGRIGNSCILKA